MCSPGLGSSRICFGVQIGLTRVFPPLRTVRVAMAPPPATTTTPFLFLWIAVFIQLGLISRCCCGLVLLSLNGLIDI